MYEQEMDVATGIKALQISSHATDKHLILEAFIHLVNKSVGNIEGKWLSLINPSDFYPKRSVQKSTYKKIHKEFTA